MKILRSLLLSACALAIAPTINARHLTEIQTDSLKQNHKIIYFGEGTQHASQDSLQQMINMFYYDQFRHFNDPRAPYFLFLSKSNSLAMGIGGVVRMRGWYDWSGAMNTSGFIPYDINIPANSAHSRWLGSTPAGTALFFRVIGNSNRFGHYQFYVEANFNGYGARDFHLKNAYAMINDWTIGYTRTTFEDPNAEPPTVDAQGPNSEISKTSVLVRYMHTFKHGISIAASAEMPASQIAANNNTTVAASDWFPNMAAFTQYEFSQGQHIRLSGIMRVLPYRDMLSAQNKNVIGWGAQLSSVFRVGTPLTFYATANAGKGYESMTNDLQVGNLDLLNDVNNPGKMYAPTAYGWFGAVQYHFRPNLFSTAVFSQQRFCPKGNLDNDTYKSGIYGALNLFWDITPRCEVAGEFNIGKRTNFNGDSKWARRVTVMVQFSF